MPKRRKKGNKFTTISISWGDKQIMRSFAKFKKETKNGKLYESDSEVFNRMMIEYHNNHPEVTTMHSTYPTILRDESQQDSSP